MSTLDCTPNEIIEIIEPPIRILIVEDCRLERDMLRLLLENQPGLQVVADAADRAHAIALAASEQPDVILLDLQLKEDTSLDFLPELVAAGPGRVVVFTGYSDPERHQEALARGAAEIVVKAQDFAVLFEAIKRVHSQAMQAQ